MANIYLNAYMGSPTADGTDGTIISTGDMTAPLSFVLDASQNETKTATLALRAGSGYETTGDTTVAITNDTNSRWQLSLDGTAWSDTIIISSTIDDTNFLFYVKASSSSTENPGNDTSVKINVSTKIVAV